MELEPSSFGAVLFSMMLSDLLFSRSSWLSFGGEAPRRDPSQGTDAGPKPSQCHHKHGPPRGSHWGVSLLKGPGSGGEGRQVQLRGEWSEGG